MRCRALILSVSLCPFAVAPVGCGGDDVGSTAGQTESGSTGDSDRTTGDEDTTVGDPSGPPTGTETGEGSSTSGSATTGTTDDPSTTTTATGTDPSTSSTSTGPETTDGTTGDAPDCPDGGLGPGDHTVELMFDGAMREFILHIPPGYDGSEATPLVLNFHGLTSNAGQQVFFSQMNDTSDAEGFLVAYPQGIQSSWNAGECCGGAQSMGVDDVGFARAVVEEIEGVTCVDPARIYATGMSNGGFMSNRLACEAADLFAAVAPVSAVIVIDTCEPVRPIPVMSFNGTTDLLVPYNGGLYTSAPDTFTGWAARNGCVGEPVETFQSGAATCMTYEECDEGVEVTLCTIDPMGHCWPGPAFCPLPPANQDISANEEMWAFFQQHPMP